MAATQPSPRGEPRGLRRRTRGSLVAFSASRATEWEVRDLEDTDLDRVVHLWDEEDAVSVFPLAEVLDARAASHPAFVATARDGRVLGAIAARVEHERAWLLRWVVEPAARHAGVGTALLAALERRLVELGVASAAALVPEDAGSIGFLTRAGFRERAGLTFLEKRRLGPGYADEHALALGAQWPDAGLWGRIGGMATEKHLIERRVILPLAEPELASRHGVVPPSAIILFGPPGTGKTTFAKAVAARLGWPFIELYPNQLDGESGVPRARALSELFAELAHLQSAVVFIDEVEELAGHRDNRPDGRAVTNELLTLIPRFRANGSRLMVCATNSVRSLDRAFSRPGRFDYLIPIGPPDREAREQIWERYVREITDAAVDFRALALESERFTPADIEFAAQRAAHAAFERSHLAESHAPACTDDFLAAIAETRPSLTPDLVASFESDIEAFGRF